MSNFVLDHSMVPPGGCFYYVQSETKARIEAGDYDSWMRAIEQHRIANKLELENLWKLHVEEWLCHDLKTKGKDWCRINGLGDVIAYGLHPIAHFVDQRFGTNLATCKSCSNRRHQLNKL